MSYFHELFALLLYWAKIFFAVLVFSPFLKKRPNYKIRAIIPVAAMILIITLLPLFQLDMNSFAVTTTYYFVASIAIFLWFILCYEGKFMDYLFHFFSGTFLSAAETR